jgi:hypothetical protein
MRRVLAAYADQRECVGGPWDGERRMADAAPLDAPGGRYFAERHRQWGAILRYVRAH